MIEELKMILDAIGDLSGVAIWVVVGFLAQVTGIDQDAIEAMQKAEAYEGIGKLVISLAKIEELQQQYVSADTYGHHFNAWDHSEIEIGNYYVFIQR